MRTGLKLIAISAIAILPLGACSGGLGLIGGEEWKTDYPDDIPAQASETWHLASVEVHVPQTLTVSEVNSYAPEADIVWREDPPGNRYEQVRAIIAEAVKRGASKLPGKTPVRLEIEMQTFHALSQKTRYSNFNVGVHNITFTAQVFNAKTGAPLTGKDLIYADLPAFTGQQALEAEAKGRTQKVRITEHVAQTIAAWLKLGPNVRDSFSRSGR